MLSPFFAKDVYAKRRKQFAAHLESDQDLAVIFNAPVRTRNNDSTHRYRPESNMVYLVGIAEEQSAALIWRSGTKVHFELIVLPRDRTKEQWNGYRWGTTRALSTFGADACFEHSKLEERVLHWLSTKVAKGKAPRIWTNALGEPELKLQLENILSKYHPRERAGQKHIGGYSDTGLITRKLRIIKDAAELETMRESGRINVEAHLRAMHSIAPGIPEYQIQAVVEGEYLRQGCPYPAYTTIAASGDNATVLHYNDNNRIMKRGELFLLDAGCEHQFYASDITRTLPVGGQYSRAQRAIMDVVHEAHQEVIRITKPGIPFSKLQSTAQEVLAAGLISLKLIKGSSAKDAVTNGKLFRYYPHGVSHFLGLDVHDDNTYLNDDGSSITLKQGMVFTVEPGLYFLPDDKTVPAEYRGIGVRIEDDVAVTRNGAEVLTADLPRSASEIEAEMRTFY